MPTVSDLLQQMLEDNTPEAPAEKTAAEHSEEDQYEKIAKELNLSPEEIEAATAELEGQEKKAEAEKKAEEAVLLGRFMARGFVDELQKVGSGTPVVNKGGGKAVQQQADASTPQDGSKVLAKIKGSVESLHTPDSPTKSDDGLGVVKKILDTAKKVIEPTPNATETNAN
jgi:hypothetical protein